MNKGKSPEGVVRLMSEDSIEIEGRGVGTFMQNNLENEHEIKVKVRYRKGGILLELANHGVKFLETKEEKQ